MASFAKIQFERTIAEIQKDSSLSDGLFSWRLIAPAKAVHFTAPIRGIMTGFSSECILVKECVHLKKQEGFQNTAANTTAGQIDSIAMKTGRQFAWNTADSLSASRKPKESGNEVF